MTSRLLTTLTLALLFTPAVAAPPLVIAHRGASGYLPEHTLEAKALAHGMAADFLEQDVVLSKDNVPVVLHDIQIDAVTDAATRFPNRHRPDGRWYALDFTVAELQQLSVTERRDPKTNRPAFPNRFPAGVGSFRIPTLDEELAFIAGLNHSTGRHTGIYVEIKQPAWHRDQGRDLSRAVLPILAKHGYQSKQDPCWLQCFEPDELRRLRSDLAYQGRLVQLTGTSAAEAAALLSPEGLRSLASFADAIGPAIPSIISGSSPDNRKITSLVHDAHAAGLAVHPYTIRADSLPPTVRSLEDLHSLLFNDAKIDGVFTDFPDRTNAWLTSHPSPSN